MNLCEMISVQGQQQGLKGKTEFAAGWLLGTVDGDTVDGSDVRQVPDGHSLVTSVRH